MTHPEHCPVSLQLELKARAVQLVPIAAEQFSEYLLQPTQSQLLSLPLSVGSKP